MCGSYGCLAAVASGRALAGQLAAAGVPAASGPELRERIRAGHPDAVRLAREAGQRWRRGARHRGHPAQPRRADDRRGPRRAPTSSPACASCSTSAPCPGPPATCRWSTSRLGDRAALAGATAMVVEHLYAPGRAARRPPAAGPSSTAPTYAWSTTVTSDHRRRGRPGRRPGRGPRPCTPACWRPGPETRLAARLGPPAEAAREVAAAYGAVAVASLRGAARPLRGRRVRRAARGAGRAGGTGGQGGQGPAAGEAARPDLAAARRARRRGRPRPASSPRWC